MGVSPATRMSTTPTGSGVIPRCAGSWAARRLTYRGGAGVYQGGMHSGRMDGSGVLDWADGFRYEGELRDGRPHGQGTYRTADGPVYEGSWREGCFGDRDGLRAWMGTSASACGFE